MKDQAMTEHDGVTSYDGESYDDRPAVALAVTPWAPISLIFGIIALGTFAVSGVSALAAIAGIITGHVARREIKAGLKAGSGWATSGLILCYFLLVIGLVARYMLARQG